jgi:hypothetical protein
MPDGKLLWSLFIPGFDAAWAFYTAQHPDIAEAGGYIRVGAAEGYTVHEMMSFDDASGVGPEESIGYAAAVAALAK